ncbi:MAG: hypothetical protein UR85_C0011G0023 [Candidatus Nomurabacteria bacterium GW2011_GWF2_35_66]|nr:MAG: hypothetical protein UR85_C0011G0023 [Candidatus Nomurabacteria bacterium GW2011_GWF2_35_66]HBM45429.1 hypothetical protein [Patescibacteria group bacterium]
MLLAVEIFYIMFCLIVYFRFHTFIKKSESSNFEVRTVANTAMIISIALILQVILSLCGVAPM